MNLQQSQNGAMAPYFHLCTVCPDGYEWRDGEWDGGSAAGLVGPWLCEKSDEFGWETVKDQDAQERFPHRRFGAIAGAADIQAEIVAFCKVYGRLGVSTWTNYLEPKVPTGNHGKVEGWNVTVGGENEPWYFQGDSLWRWLDEVEAMAVLNSLMDVRAGRAARDEVRALIGGSKSLRLWVQAGKEPRPMPKVPMEELPTRMKAVEQGWLEIDRQVRLGGVNAEVESWLITKLLSATITTALKEQGHLSVEAYDTGGIVVATGNALGLVYVSLAKEATGEIGRPLKCPNPYCEVQWFHPTKDNQRTCGHANCRKYVQRHKAKLNPVEPTTRKS